MHKLTDLHLIMRFALYSSLDYSSLDFSIEAHRPCLKEGMKIVLRHRTRSDES